MPMNLFYGFIGCCSAPQSVYCGARPTATIAMLLPITFGLPTESALIMLAGIFYGAQYGGSTTAILINLPAKAPGCYCNRRYQMARNGRAGAALATAALGSFFAGTVATILLAVPHRLWQP